MAKVASSVHHVLLSSRLSTRGAPCVGDTKVCAGVQIFLSQHHANIHPIHARSTIDQNTPSAKPHRMSHTHVTQYTTTLTHCVTHA